jgi:hypothetical protein
MSAPNPPQWYIHDITRKVSEILDDDKVYTRLLLGAVEIYSLSKNTMIRVRFNGSGFFYMYGAYRIQDMDKRSGGMTRSSCAYISDNPEGIATREPDFDKINDAVEGLNRKQDVISQVNRVLSDYFGQKGHKAFVGSSTLWVKPDGNLIAENRGTCTVADDLVVWVRSARHQIEIVKALHQSGLKVRTY